MSANAEAFSMNMTAGQGSNWALRTRLGVVLGANAALWLVIAAALHLAF